MQVIYFLLSVIISFHFYVLWRLLYIFTLLCSPPSSCFLRFLSIFYGAHTLLPFHCVIIWFCGISQMSFFCNCWHSGLLSLWQITLQLSQIVVSEAFMCDSQPCHLELTFLIYIFMLQKKKWKRRSRRRRRRRNLYSTHSYFTSRLEIML